MCRVMVLSIQKHRKTAFIVSLCLVALWMLYIFSFSAAPAEVSTKDSSKVTEKVVRVYEKDYDTLPEVKQKTVFETVQSKVRKVAHFVLYCVLGMLVCVSCFLCSESDKLKYVIGFCICVLYGASDEIHQYFSPGRAALVKDVLIDSAGAAVGMAIVLFVLWTVMRKKKTKSE